MEAWIESTHLLTVSFSPKLAVTCLACHKVFCENVTYYF